MSSEKPVVLIAFDRASEIVDEIQDACGGVRLHVAERPEDLVPQLEALQPEIVFSIKGRNFPASAHKPIMSFPSVRWVQVGGSGFDHLSPWDEEQLVVTNCSGVLSSYLSETVIGAMLALNGNLLTYREQQRNRIWSPQEFRPISDQSILIVGLGHIGRQVADKAKALGMRVVGIRRRQENHSSVDQLLRPEQLADAVGNADVISVHLRLSEETECLFDAEMFAQMQSDALFLNTSRGGVVDEKALIATLQNGGLRGAYLDVFQEEPLPKGSPLWGLENVLVTPHCADDIKGWHLKFARFFAANLERWIRSEQLQNVVPNQR